MNTNTTTVPVHRCDPLTVAGTLATLYRDGRSIGLVQCISIAPGQIRYFGMIASRHLSGQAHLTQAQAEADIIAWHEGRDPEPYHQHAVVPLALSEADILRRRAERAEGKLAAIRAMATQGVPNCINLAAIDRIIGEAPAPVAAPVAGSREGEALLDPETLAYAAKVIKKLPSAAAASDAHGQLMVMLTRATLAARTPMIGQHASVLRQHLKEYSQTKADLAAAKAEVTRLKALSAAPVATAGAGQADGWVSVEERLPEPMPDEWVGIEEDDEEEIKHANRQSEDVLICRTVQTPMNKPYEAVKVARYFPGSHRGKGGWLEADSGNWVWPHHWQPLPAAPQQPQKGGQPNAPLSDLPAETH